MPSGDLRRPSPEVPNPPTNTVGDQETSSEVGQALIRPFLIRPLKFQSDQPRPRFDFSDPRLGLSDPDLAFPTFEKLQLVVSDLALVSPSFDLLNLGLNLAFSNFDWLCRASIWYVQALTECVELRDSFSDVRPASTATVGL